MTHVCWAYQPRSVKKLLSYKSAHSKIVKNGLAMACLSAAIKKSCAHAMRESFMRQVERLEAAGFPRLALGSISRRLLCRLKLEQKNGAGAAALPRERRGKFAVIPYLHTV